MTKAELINALRMENNFTKNEAVAVVNTFFDEMSNALAKGDRVEIRGLCSIHVKKYKAYTGRNPKTGKKVKSKHQQYTDSLKNVKYDYIFPIWGQGAYKKGFDIPYPIGIMGNYMWMDQGIDITNLQLGLEGTNNDFPISWL